MREATGNVLTIGRAAIGLALGVVASTFACAQSLPEAAPGPWKFAGSLYGYLPTLSGRSSAPADSGGTPIEVPVSKIIDALKFTVMGSFDAHNGRWGMFTDVLYLDLGGDKQQSKNFTIGDTGLPADTTADLGLDLKGLIWTLAGEYRLVASPELTLDGLAGARLLDLKQTLRWNISGSLGPLDPAGRTGVRKSDLSVVDAIVGVKGRVALGSEQRWYVPFYADIGTGQSDLTWQAATGLSYAYSWGEINALWRYLGYDMKAGKSIVKLNFSGPMVGATFRW
jgi:hypothetical protein